MVFGDLERMCRVWFDVVDGENALAFGPGRDAAEPNLDNVRILFQNFPRGRNKATVAKTPIVFAVKNIVSLHLCVRSVDRIDLTAASAVVDPLDVVSREPLRPWGITVLDDDGFLTEAVLR